MVDSPVGTAAWIWERRRTWSDNPTGDPVDILDRDFLCTTASIYWLTRTIGTSFRYYREHFIPGWQPLHARRPAIAVPTAFGISPKEVVMMPRRVAEEATNRRWTVFDSGGHSLLPRTPPGWWRSTAHSSVSWAAHDRRTELPLPTDLPTKRLVESGFSHPRCLLSWPSTTL